jgi:methylmalonyl-CoA mutase cobalamin-binding subunit
VAEEHFFGMYLRNKLGARYHHRPRGNQGPRLLCACFPGELHEIGLLLFSLTAYDHGLRPVLLGANTPLEELAQAARSGRCHAIVLSGSIKPEPPVLSRQLPKLVADSGIPVFVGGLASVFEHDAIAAAGAIPIGNELLPGTRRIRNALASVMLTTATKTPTETAL